MKPFLHSVVLRLLSQVIKICLRHGVRLQEVSDLIKEVYVSEALNLLKKEAPSEPPSASRLTAMTGVHRKDVTKITASGNTERKKPNFIARIITQWQDDKRFSDPDSTPRPLSSQGRQSEFAALVDSVTGGAVDPYAVIFEMERLGVIDIDKENKIATLLWENYVPPVEEESALEMLVEDSADLTAAILSNIDLNKNSAIKTSTLPHLHLKTEYSRIPEDKIPIIQKFFLEEGKLFHRKIRSFLSKYDLDLNSTGDKKLKNRSKDNKSVKEMRVAACTFSFCEEKGEDQC